MAENTVHLLTQGAGYGVLVGVGAVFAGGMILTTFLLQNTFMKMPIARKHFLLLIVQ